MSRTYRHTPPKYVFEQDGDGWFLDTIDWQVLGKHYRNYKSERLGAQQRNRKIRYDKTFLHDFDNYIVPNPKRGWWD